MAAILTASTLVLGGCQLPVPGGNTSASGSDPANTSGQSTTTGGGTTTGTSGTSTPTGTSSTTPTPPAPTDWTDTEKNLMKQYLEGVVLPFTSGTWKWYWDTEYECISGEGSGNTVAAVKGVYDKAAGWKFVEYDEDYESYRYEYELTEGSIQADIYMMSSSIPVEVDAWYQPAQQPTTDTEWNSEVSEVMNGVLGELLPFYPLGEYYTVYQVDDYTLIVYDYYTTDLTGEYAALLEKAGSGYTKVEEASYTYYEKVKENGEKIDVMVAYDDEDGYGNMIQAMLVPNTTEVAKWEDIPLTAIETAFGFKVPSFEAASYVFYEHDGALIIQGATSTDLSESYATSIEALGLLGGEGAYVNWEETASIAFEALTETDASEQEVVVGFQLALEVTTPTSEFSKDWPAESVSKYLESFELSVEVPSLLNETGKDVKIAVLTYEELYQEVVEYYEMLNEWIEALGGEPYTEEEIAEIAAPYAAENAGMYISMYGSDASALVEAYNGKFDTTAWTYEKVEQKDEDTGEVVATYHYWVENETGLTLCVYEASGIFYVQICEPGEAPVPPTPGEDVSVTFSELGFNNGDVVTEVVLDESTNTKVVFDKGTNANNAPKYYTTGAAVRCYGGNTFTVSSDLTITEIDLSFASGEGSNAVSTDVGTYEAGVWTGSANSVTFTIGGTSGHRRLASMTVKF